MVLWMQSEPCEIHSVPIDRSLGFIVREVWARCLAPTRGSVHSRDRHDWGPRVSHPSHAEEGCPHSPSRLSHPWVPEPRMARGLPCRPEELKPEMNIT